MGKLSAIEMATVVVGVWRTDEKAQEQAMAVSYCESGWDTGATNISSVEHSVGPWQINLKAHGDSISEENARNPHRSTQFAHMLWSASGRTFSKHWVNCSRRARVTSGMRRALVEARRREGTQKGKDRGQVEGLGPDFGIGGIVGDILGAPLRFIAFRVMPVVGGVLFILIAIYMLWKSSTAGDAARAITKPIRRKRAA